MSRPSRLVVVGAVVALVGTFLPWLTSGSVDRSSYALLDLVERLGFSSGGVMDAALTLWPIVPLLLVVSVIMAVVGRRIPAAWSVATWSVTGLYVGATAAALTLAPDAGLVRMRYGVWVSLIGALAMLGATLWAVVSTVRSQ